MWWKPCAQGPPVLVCLSVPYLYPGQLAALGSLLYLLPSPHTRKNKSSCNVFSTEFTFSSVFVRTLQGWWTNPVLDEESEARENTPLISGGAGTELQACSASPGGHLREPHRHMHAAEPPSTPGVMLSPPACSLLIGQISPPYQSFSCLVIFFLQCTQSCLKDSD